MDGNCIYCNDRSAGAPTLLVSGTLIPSFYWFFMCSFSFSCCQCLVLDVIPLFNVDCHRLRSARVAEELFVERVNSPLSLDTSSRCQYVIVTHCHLSLSTGNLLEPLGYGSHCREGINGNPVLTLDYFSLLERLAQLLFRSIASPFDYARFPCEEGTGPHRGLFHRSRLTVS
jgi:hypothetical protein